MIEIAKRMEALERKTQKLKSPPFLKEELVLEKRLVSLRGLGKLLVSENELEDAIDKAEISIFSKIEDDVHH